MVEGSNHNKSSNCDELSEDDIPMLDSRSSEAIHSIESMVFSLLSQLAFCGRTPCARPSDNSRGWESGESGESGENAKRRMSKSKIELQLADRNKESLSGSANVKYIRYPRKCPKGSARPLAQLFRVLDLTHEALVNDIPATKRDIYYRDVPLFKRQRVVDDLVDDIAATFNLERSDLNIRATSKGLVCGSGLVIYLITGEVIHVNDTEGTLIPVGEDIEKFSIDPEISWVLIVEKEAVFQTICRLKLSNHPSMPGRGLIITGKGYPDIATRHLVKTLADSLPLSIPILGLVDGDPYGLDILSVYKYGSRSLQHENAKLAAARIKWLGLWASELEHFGLDRDRLLPITRHDEKKALAMLRRPASSMPRRWRKELMHMLHSRRKAEIEIVSTMIYSDVKDKADGLHQRSQPIASTTDHLTLASCSAVSITTAFGPLTTPLSAPLSTPYSLSPHAPLTRYLVSKVDRFVNTAQPRVNTPDT